MSKRNDAGFGRWLKAQGPSALSWMTVQQMERAFIAGRESVKRRARKGEKG